MNRARLADALFSPVQQRVLALLFANPERSLRCGELIRLARGGTGGVHRFLRRLAEAGWVTVTPVGNQAHYRANRACPAFPELRGLVLKTIGAPRATERRGSARPFTPAPHRAPRPAPAPERAEGSGAAPAGDGWKSW